MPPKRSARARAWDERKKELLTGGKAFNVLAKFNKECRVKIEGFYEHGWQSPYEPLVDPTPFIEELKGTWTWDSSGFLLGEEAQKLYRLDSAEDKDAARFDLLWKGWRNGNDHRLTWPALIQNLAAMSTGGGRQNDLESIRSKGMLGAGAAFDYLSSHESAITEQQHELLAQSPNGNVAVDNDQEFMGNSKGIAKKVRMMTNVVAFRERLTVLPEGTVLVCNNRVLRVEGVRDIDEGHFWAVYDVSVLAINDNKVRYGSNLLPTGVLELPDAMFCRDFEYIHVPGLELAPERRKITDFLKPGGAALLPSPLNFPASRGDGGNLLLYGSSGGGKAMTLAEHESNLKDCLLLQRLRRHAAYSLYIRNDITNDDLFSEEGDGFLLVNAAMIPSDGHLAKALSLIRFVRNPDVKAIVSRYTTYQKGVVEAYNPKCNERTPTMTMMPMNFDETSKEGMECVALELLLRYRLIEYADKEKTKFRIGRHGGGSRRLHVIGDHLTYVQLKRLIPNMVEKLGSPETAANARVVLAAVQAMVALPGDLHHAMHYLDELFRRTYGGCLQMFQEVIGMRHLSKEPIDSFQLARRLVTLVGTEGQRYELDEWVRRTDSITMPPGASAEAPSHLNLIELGGAEFETAGGAADAVLAIIRSLQTFRVRLETSEDRVVSMLAQQLSSIERFFQFEVSKGNCDAAAVECHVLEQGKFYAGSHKSHYTDLVMSETEDRLWLMQPMVLQDSRINRFPRNMELEYEEDEDGEKVVKREHRCTSKDGVVEQKNDFGKKMEGSLTNKVHATKMQGIDLQRKCHKTRQHGCGHDPSASKSSSKTDDTADRLAITRLYRAMGGFVENETRKRMDFDMNRCCSPYVKFAKKPEAVKQRQYSEEEEALARVFSKKPTEMPSREIEEAEQALDDEGDASAGDDGDAYAVAMTAAQLKKQEQKSYHAWDARGDGNWAEKGIAALKGVDAKRAEGRRLRQRLALQAKEAAELFERQSPALNRRVPRARKESWRRVDREILADMAAPAAAGSTGSTATADQQAAASSI